MDFLRFYEKSDRFSVVLFVQPSDWDEKRPLVEELGKRKNVKVVVQPCPYEGIEFLYRVAHDLIHHETSLDKEVFWQSLDLRSDIDDQVFEKISTHHYDYLCAILQQDADKVSREGKALEELSDAFVLP